MFTLAVIVLVSLFAVGISRQQTRLSTNNKLRRSNSYGSRQSWPEKSTNDDTERTKKNQPFAMAGQSKRHDDREGFTEKSACDIRQRKKNICFHTNELNQRGTTQAVFDYAHFNEVLLNNTSIIVAPTTVANITQNSMALPQFIRRFGKNMIHFYTPLAGKRAGTETLSLKSNGNRKN